MEHDCRVKVVLVSPRQYRCPSTVQMLTPQLGRQHSYSWYTAGITAGHLWGLYEASWGM